MKLTTQQLDELRKKLELLRTDLNNEITVAEKIPEFGSDVESSEDLPEEADEAEELSTNAGIAQALRTRRDAVEAALQKISAGTYGSCEQCRGEIDITVLTIDPESRLCQACKTGSNRK